jgi:hypothetical protein
MVLFECYLESLYLLEVLLEPLSVIRLAKLSEGLRS